MASLAQCLNVLFNVFATQCQRLDVVDVELTRQVPTQAHGTVRTDGLPNGTPHLRRSIVATGYRSTPLRMALDRATRVVVSVMERAPAGMGSPLSTVKAPGTHGAPPFLGAPPYVEHPPTYSRE